MYRFNPTTLDAVPAPAYLFKSTAEDHGTFHPKLLLFNRGDRDFFKYKIYKRSTYTNWSWSLIDSTTGDNYIDTTEDLDTTSSSGTNSYFNLFYFVKAEDNSYKVSINSDTIKYLDIVCLACPPEPIECCEDNRFTIVSSPIEFSLSNYPNPFNPVTKIQYSIPIEGNVKILIYNSLGQTVKELVNEFKGIGSYTTEFNGSSLSSGIYYYKIESGNFVQIKKMILIK